MKSISKVVGAAALMLASAGALAGELVVTAASDAKRGGQTQVALDIATDGGVSGISFFLYTGALKAGSVDLSKCVSELPKGFSGTCAQRPDGIGVVAYADGMANFEAGMVSIGSVAVPVEAALRKGGLEVRELVFADVNGERVESRATVVE